MSAGEDWLDSKRLIGPHAFGDGIGALLEVGGEGPAFAARIGRWRTLAAELSAALGWAARESAVHPHAGGAMLTLAAPVDGLYTATEVAEAAWVAALDPDGGIDPAVVARLVAARDEEADPAARRLYEEALRRGVPALLDEHGLLLGLGLRGRHWPPRHAPGPDTVPWETLGTVPVALVTGTNGKTTTSRLLAAMATAAGHVTGLASTDGARVGDRLLDAGDVAGPGGARRVLREPTLSLAVLETARGGLLRRGLALACARVALVTNIAEDHLGDGGVDSLERLAEVKFLVLRGLAPDGTAVLNADDPLCRARGEERTGPIAWFSLAGRIGTGPGAFLDGERLVHRDVAGRESELATVADLPTALGGRARYNVANALAAATAARALGLPFEAIRDTLRTFGRATGDNAGRGTTLEIGGIRVLVDFGHNPAGVAAVLSMFPRAERERLHVMFGQAGDRPDSAIRDLARVVHAAGTDRFVLKEMGEYRRGRPPGEVRAVLRDELRRLGVAPDAISEGEGELEAASQAMAAARSGDVVVLFVHSELDAVIEALGAGPALTGATRGP